MKSTGKGFSLVELMIVVAIIAFLATMAVPRFGVFLAKAKRAEAYAQLASLYAAQKAYWAEHGTYSSTLAGEGGIGWKPEGYRGGGVNESFYYTYGFPGSEGKNYFTGKLQTPAAALSGARADVQGFVAYAVGDIDGDGKPDIITIDENNRIQILQDDIAD